MTHVRFTLAGLLALPLLAGCNTIEGVGMDIQAAGRGVSSAANYVEREMSSPRDRQVRTADISYRNTSVTVGSACDANEELDGGSASGLPACRSGDSRPPLRNY